MLIRTKDATGKTDANLQSAEALIVSVVDFVREDS